jgi:hypothetical protein
MAKAGASVEELVSIIERGDLRLPEIQHQYAWRSTRVREPLWSSPVESPSVDKVCRGPCPS